MNPGIVSGVVSANTVYVLIASYFLFIEILLPLQLLGACLMVVAVVIVSVYRDDKGGSDALHAFDDVENR